MDSGSSVRFAGPKSATVTLLPRARKDVHYRVVPLHCGYVALPRVQVRCLPSKALLLDPAADSCQVFVCPARKQPSDN